MTNYSANYDETIPFSDTCLQMNLATNTEQTFTIPGAATQKYQALFGYNSTANIYVGYNVTTAAPGAGLQTSSNNIEFRPDKRFVHGGDVLHFACPDTAGGYVGMSLRTIPG
jgi:hypothetical protein